MTNLPDPPENRTMREGQWAAPVSKLRVAGLPAGALNLNVDGRSVSGPLQGFGQLWQKTYRIRLIAPRDPMTGNLATPAAVIRQWKENFPRFWPRGNNFYAPLTQIAPGEVVVLNLSGPVRMPLSTGVYVIYADDESFSFMTPLGHMFAGMITFSAYEDASDLYAQVQVLIRASDPLYELFFRVGYLAKQEDAFWNYTLLALAQHLGATGKVEIQATCVDPRRQWSQVANLWQNAAIRTGIYTMAAPLRWARGLFKRGVSE
jgi:hypothetical protein